MADAGRRGERQSGEADGHDEASERHLRGPERQHDAGAARALAQAGQAAGQRGRARRAGTASRRHRACTPHPLAPGPARRPSSPRVRGKLHRLRGRPPPGSRGLRRPRAWSGTGGAGNRTPAAAAGARAHAAAAPQGRPPAAPRCALSRPPRALPGPGAGSSRRRRRCPRARALPPPRAEPGPRPEHEPGPSGAGAGGRRCCPCGPASALAPLTEEGSENRGRVKGEGGRSPGRRRGRGVGAGAGWPNRYLAWGWPGRSARRGGGGRGGGDFPAPNPRRGGREPLSNAEFLDPAFCCSPAVPGISQAKLRTRS